MPLLRTIFAFLIALSLATAPIGAAMAASSMAASSAHADMAGMTADLDAGMDDCAKMGQQAGQGDCPCCDTKAKCTPDLCLSKCFNVLGDVVEPDYVWPQIAQMKHVEGTLKPPNQSRAPPPPPPRT